MTEPSKSSSSSESSSHETLGYFIVFVALMALLALTVGMYYVDLGPANSVVAIAIAAVKASLVLSIFMHLRGSPRLVWVFALGGFFWLSIMAAGFLHDYVSRPLDPPFTNQPVAGAMHAADPPDAN